MQDDWMRRACLTVGLMIGMVVFALCGRTAAAFPPVISLDGRSSYELAGQIEMYREPAGKLTIDDINKGVDTEKFQPVGQAAVALGQISDAVWFRARVMMLAKSCA